MKSILQVLLFKANKCLAKKIFFIYNFSLIIYNFSPAQPFQNVLIDGTTNANEPSIIMNPKNTNQLAAGANFDNVYYSTNGGLTWTNNFLTSTYGIWGDPALIVDTSGNFYYFHLSNSQGGGWLSPGWLDRMVCQKSTNGGATWSTGTFTGLNGGKHQDKPWAIVDFADSSNYKNNMYLTWTEFDYYSSTAAGDSSRIQFSKSPDGGITWSPAVTISEFSGDCIDEDNTTEGAVPAVGTHGEIYVAWSNNLQIYFDRSLDGGQTWLTNDIIAATQPVGWDYTVPGLFRCNGLPVTACDISNSPYHGTVYINWTDQRNGLTDTDVWLAKSTDNGNTWSLPVRVNNDAPGKHNFMSWMCIDRTTGYLYIVFYDRRNFAGSATDVYVAVSTDGGATFNNMKVSTTNFVPTAGVFIGDYINITAHNNHVRPIWTRIDNNSSSVWTAIMDFTTGLNNPGETILNAHLTNSPNPFNGSTAITFTITQNDKLNMDVTDVTGRKVINLFTNKEFTTGTHQWILDNNTYQLSPGIYFLRLGNDKQSGSLKMVVTY